MIACACRRMAPRSTGSAAVTGADSTPMRARTSSVTYSTISSAISAPSSLRRGERVGNRAAVPVGESDDRAPLRGRLPAGVLDPDVALDEATGRRLALPGDDARGGDHVPGEVLAPVLEADPPD